MKRIIRTFAHILQSHRRTHTVHSCISPMYPQSRLTPFPLSFPSLVTIMQQNPITREENMENTQRFKLEPLSFTQPAYKTSPFALFNL